jgi:acetylornithine aminotransferase
LIHTSNLYYNSWTGKLSKNLITATHASGAFPLAASAFIANSGSEANEAAIKFCRKVGKTLDPTGSKHEIVSFHNSFHGRTMGSLSATPNPKYQAPFSPMLPGFRYGTFNDVAAVNTLITPATAGVLVEPIQGEGGVNVATTEFLHALRKRCSEVGALLVYDEIQSGMARTGTLWAHAGIVGNDASPDILTTAKALGNGIPVGATIVAGHVSEKIVPGDHGTTFGGNPFVARVACHVLGRLDKNGEVAKGVVRKEELLRKRMDMLRNRWTQHVKETRGRGLLLGLQMSGNTGKVVDAARERGLLIITCGTETLRLVPPLVATEEELETGMRILEEAMEAVLG